VLTDLHCSLYNALRSELGAKVPAFQPLGDPAERALLALLNEQVSLDGFEESARHVLAVREAEARDRRSMQYFGFLVWSPNSFGIARSMEIGETSSRAKAKNGTNGAKFGRVEPLEAHEYPDGDQEL
jgi:hypothetical protein